MLCNSFPCIGKFLSFCCLSFHDFPRNSKQDAPFHSITYDYSCADCDGLCDHLRHVPREDIIKLSTSAAASEFCEWVPVVIDVYIPHHKYQVKPHSSPWFLAACAATIVHRYQFFCLYQQNESSKSKVKFRHTSNHCKRVLEAAKLAYATKTKESITSQKRGSWDFWQIVLNQGKSAIPPDRIPVVILKNCAPELSYILAELFNMCLKECCFPDCWKFSSVVPAFKNVGEKSTNKNYHPVSFLSMVSKVFEKLVNNRIVDHLEKCDLFSDFQYGFRSS